VLKGAGDFQKKKTFGQPRKQDLDIWGDQKTNTEGGKERVLNKKIFEKED